jgi:hypothetical protein
MASAAEEFAMSVTPTSFPAGWYPAPDGSSGTWWWDGAQWAPPGHQPPSANGLAKLAVATQALLLACGVISLVTIAVEAFGISAVTAYLDGDDSAIELINGYDQVTPAISILSAVAVLATGALWAIWQYRVAKQVPGRTRRSPGWHAGSWFVPVISFWFPYQNISDLWQAIGRARPTWQILWWLCWAGSNVVIQIASRLYMSAEDLEQFRVALSVSIIGELLLLAAAPLAWLIVRQITQGIVTRHPAPQAMPLP